MQDLLPKPGEDESFHSIKNRRNQLCDGVNFLDQQPAFGQVAIFAFVENF